MVALTAILFTFASFEFVASLSNVTAVKNGFVKSINPKVISEQVLFKDNQPPDVQLYRVPLLTYTPGGDLLIVAEGRQNKSDAGLKYIATRRSGNGGLSWQPEVLIHNDSTTRKEDNLGAVLVDNVAKEIYIFFVICPHVNACDAGAVPSVMYLKSTDDGITWKPPVNVTAQAGPRNFAPGPGYGIQKKIAPFKGRLIVCGHGGQVDANGVFCLLSDNHGVTWRWGATVLPIPAATETYRTGDFVPGECQPAELPDGSIMLNVRNQEHYHCRCRIVMRSYDGMETIDRESIHLDSTLVEPAVASSILSHAGVLFFSNPSSEFIRINMMLKWSFDNGATWPGKLPIWLLVSGYSCMTAFPPDLAPGKQKYIYLAYEKGEMKAVDTISFVIISLDGTP